MKEQAPFGYCVRWQVFFQLNHGETANRQDAVRPALGSALIEAQLQWMSRHRGFRESTVTRYARQPHIATVNADPRARVSERGEQATGPPLLPNPSVGPDRPAGNPARERLGLPPGSRRRNHKPKESCDRRGPASVSSSEGRRREFLPWEVSMLIRGTVLVALAVGLAVQSHSKVCEIEYEMQNKNWKVRGPLTNIECGLPQETSAAPFGNWEIETESSRRHGHQFQGWCHNTERCYTNDPNKCKTYCKKDLYEWNSCKNDARLSPANRKLCNDDDGTKQKSSRRGKNTHGQGHVNFVVSRPTDTNRDLIADSGGYEGALNHRFTLAGHRMEMWELDHWRPLDDKVGTLRFPTLTAPTGGINCDIYGCGGGRLGSLRSKKSDTTIVSATASVRATEARLVEYNGSCSDPLEDPTCD